MITVLIYGHLGMVPREQKASEVSMTRLLQPASAHDWTLSKAKQPRLSLSLLFACFSICISVIPFSIPKCSSCGRRAVNHEWHDISILSWWRWFYACIDSLKVINFFINNEITRFPRHCSSKTCSKESVKPTVPQKVEQNHLFRIWESRARAPSLILFHLLRSPSFVSTRSKDESVLLALFPRWNFLFVSTHTLKHSRKKRNSSVTLKLKPKLTGCRSIYGNYLIYEGE